MPPHKQFFDATWLYNTDDDADEDEKWHDYTIRWERGAIRSGVSIFTNEPTPSNRGNGPPLGSGKILFLGANIQFDLAAFFFDGEEETDPGEGQAEEVRWFFSSTVGTNGALNINDRDHWTEFAPTFVYEFGESGAEGFEGIDLDSWIKSPIENRPGSYYWVMAFIGDFGSMPDQRQTADAPPTVRQIQMRPRAAYCTHKDVSDLLQLKTGFTDTTRPNIQTVESYIYAAQAWIDHWTYKTWRISYKYQEGYDFNIAGFKLIERYPRDVSRLEVWDGARWEKRRQGRRGDFFFVPSTGMIYFSRYFLLPARLHSYNAPVWLWGWAEFTYPVRVTYLHGSDVNRDRRGEGGMVTDIARKQAAIDVARDLDNTTFTISGGDKVTLERKIDTWEEEINDRLETLRGIVIF